VITADIQPLAKPDPLYCQTIQITRKKKRPRNKIKKTNKQQSDIVSQVDDYLPLDGALGLHLRLLLDTFHIGDDVGSPFHEELLALRP
jgi:hypothetical protein